MHRVTGTCRASARARCAAARVVYELVVAVLAASSHALRPQDVIDQAERLHGHQVPPSSIRNCLRQSARRIEGPIERIGYGRYRLRR